MSLLDDALFDIRREAIEREAKRAPRIGTGARAVSGLSEVVADANARSARYQAQAGNQFTDGGYLALVRVQHCEACSATATILDGIFSVELHSAGGRRLTRLDPRAQWPLRSGHTKEVRRESVPFCSGCLSDLGFDRIVGASDAPTITIG